MPEWMEATAGLLPQHLLRPWALWGLLVAPVLLLWGRRRGRGAVPPGVIDEALLPHLLVQGGPGGRLRPADTLAAALACFSIGLAGPAWEREPPPLALEQAPLLLVLDLSDAMDADDLPPSRIARARAKLQQLLAERGDAPTGLVVYAGSAHLVLPPTQDRAIIATYLDVLGTSLMPTPGNAPAAALALALDWADRSAAPGTVLFLTAGWPATDLPRTQRLLAGSRQRPVVWAIGTPEGGLLHDGDGRLRTDAQGRSRRARLEVAELEALRDGTGASLVAVSRDDGDVGRVQALIARHRTEAVEQDPTRRWRDRGPWFVWPGLLALLMSFRRGWTIRSPGLATLGAGLQVFVIAAMLAGTPALADARGDAQAEAPVAWVDAWRQRIVGWFLTPDQQGRWWLEHGEPGRASRHFADPFWRGIAHARAGQWPQAAEAFAHVDSAAGWFNQAQALGRSGRLVDAVAAYDQALLRRPGWPEALADRERVRSLIPPARDDAPNGDVQPGDGDGSEEGRGRARKTGPPRRLGEAEVAELWLQRLDTSPAGFLQRKFTLQAQAAVASGAPTTRSTRPAATTPAVPGAPGARP